MRIRNVLLLMGLGLMTAVLGVLGLLLFWSYPGRPQPFVDEHGEALPGSLSEKIFIDVNGVKQGMIIESKNSANPVMLYLHGTMPDYFLSKGYPTGLEEVFTMVWWEQRGAGLSYNPEIPWDGHDAHDDQLPAGLFLGSLQTREYTLGEKLGLWRGKFSAGVTPLLGEVITTDLSQTLPAVDLPVYFFHGSYDYTVNYALARAYTDRLRAPLKGFYTFEPIRT